MEGLVLNGPFPVINIKISEIRQYSGDFVICYRKNCAASDHNTFRRQDSRPVRDMKNTVNYPKDNGFIAQVLGCTGIG